MTEDDVKSVLASIKYPGYSRDIVSFGMVRNIELDGSDVTVELNTTSQNREIVEKIKEDCENALSRMPGVGGVDVRITRDSEGDASAAAQDPWSNQKRVPGIKRIFAVASGKGGVGKSTVAANLSCALARQGAKVGLLDCDIYGPSIPLMMGVHEQPVVGENRKIVPLTNYGVKLMSVGFLVDGDSPVIWRGPLIMKIIQQFLMDVDWGELDYLIVDLPPGTGDAQLSLCQTVPLDGGIIVTTPQEASIGVVRKGIGMFNKVNVPVLGIIENMSYFTAPGGERIEIFGYGGGKAEAGRQNIDFLGEIPIYMEIREGGDSGQPVAAADEDSPTARVFREIAERLKKHGVS